MSKFIRNNKKEIFVKHILDMQQQIIVTVEEIESGEKFIKDNWVREEGGGGLTCILNNGKVFEKAGVNTSQVHGKLNESMQAYFKTEYQDFFACGLSLVMHPLSPMVPTVHANYRYFELYDEQGKVVSQWFGGGSDLTPHYLFEEDAAHFHQVQKDICDSFDTDFYPKYKKACDQYFYNHHRKEARGIGGIFFDYLKPTSQVSSSFLLEFVTALSSSFTASYLPIVLKRKNLHYNEEQKKWQEIRRGRYVEFNLIHDKGTLFGLKTNGRIESIFMSLPKTVRWEYDHKPEPNSEEDKLVQVLKTPKDWI